MSLRRVFAAWRPRGTTANVYDEVKDGANGMSAYQQAVAGGFVGTEAQWRASLAGNNGMSAYQQALAAGFVGTEAAWLNSLRGAAGDSKVRYIKRGLQTNASGVLAIPVPLANMAVAITPRTLGAMIDTIVETSPSGVPTITVTFKKINTGALGLTVGNLLTATILAGSVGVITFDFFAAEPTA